MPQRIQLRRTKGWKKPVGAVVVGRPSAWGNPYAGPGAVEAFRRLLLSVEADDDTPIIVSTVLPSGFVYTHLCTGDALLLCAQTILARLPELRGRDLCCWCRPGKPCHADVLLELANR